jgi:CHASE2 domain-containing sensor protein/tRNA A-37 threonylcarbamoyl transferase component Bud32
MGVVYLAEQDVALRRRVALKLIKPGMDSKQVLARFESERQALALLNHPHIARVFDAGSTEQGHPYFVMEYVAGVPITEYCDRHLLTNRDRLALFLQVCDAIQHAHGKGILHRDIKPSNVLVAEEDGKPVPKVIDFGVAKATNQPLTERTLFTEQGALVGTPEYMSPEQADNSGVGVDARTDVYSLGVLLFELLVGAPPLDPKFIRRAGYAEMLRMIREEQPPTPSQRISGMGATAAEVSRRRQRDVRALRRELRGDLDAIVAKALAKDRAQRYASAADVREDVQRHLAGETVRAKRASFAEAVALPAVVATATALLAVALLHIPAGAALERRGLDVLFRLRGTHPPPSDLCVVAIDRASFSALHLASDAVIPRALQADLIHTLRREGARVVAYDVLFVDPSTAHDDAALVAAARAAGNVVLGVSSVVGAPGDRVLRVGPFGALADVGAGLGEVNLPVDRDGVVREGWLQREAQPSLAAAAYSVATGRRAHRDVHLIDYYGPSGTIPTVSFYQALRPETLPEHFFRDRIVFIGLAFPPGVWGSPASVRGDVWRTPFGDLQPGVEVHATIAANLLEGRRVHVLSTFSETILVVLVPCLAAFTLLRLRGAAAAITFVALEGLAWTAAVVAFTLSGLWPPVMTVSVVQLPLISLVAALRVVRRRRRA